MKGAISWGGGLDELGALHTAQADIALGGHSFPRGFKQSIQKSLGPLSDNIEFATSRLAALSDPHGLDALQGGSGAESMHLPRNSSDSHLAAYAVRGSTNSLPTVAEDDIFSAVGGLELGLDAQHHLRETHQPASALQDQHNGDASRTLIIRNVAPDVSDEELRSIFQAFGDVRHLHSALKPQGVIVVTYFDLRAATNAVSTLNGTLIQGIPISVACADAREKDPGNVNQGTMMFHDSDNTNEHLVWLFSKFGAVKGIWEAPNRPSQKFITFFDVRHAAAALRAMNRSAESLNKMPGQLTAQQVAALQPSISAPNLLQLGQLSSQLAASESQGKQIPGLWDNSPSSSAMESLMQLAKQHNQPQRMPQVQSHQNLASAAFSATDAPSQASLLASASRHGSQHDLQVRGCAWLRQACRSSPLGGYPSRTGSAQGMMGGLMAGYGGLPMYGGGGLDPTGMLAAGYDFGGMGLDGWMPPGPLQGYGANGMGMPYPPFPQAVPPAFPPGGPGMPLPPTGLPDLPPRQQAQLMQQAQLYAQLQAQQALMMGQKGAGTPAALQAAAAQFLQQHGSMAGGAGPPMAGMGMPHHSQREAEKLYALNPEKIQRGEDRRTTLMIKNIPNKYTQKMLLATVDEQFKGTYDFFYLPIDFKNKCNVGYAFINMVQPIDIIPLMHRFNNRKWERFNSEKVCSISYARIQGRAALVQHFQNSSLMHEDKRCRPILFTVEDNAAVAGEQEAFPTPSHSGTSSTGAATATEPRSLSASANNSHNKLSSLPGGGSNSNLAALASGGGGNNGSLIGGSSNNLAALSGGGGGTHVFGGSTSNLAAMAGAGGGSSSTSNLAALAGAGGGSGSSSNSVVAKAASALASTAATTPVAEWQ
ncbi:RNA recognition motif 2-domain-containing protein [Dunaliella salina]|uniref:RNA recognition motif 2-domain-containing protein n=1 Tax=Dunaliella salina TaxID=3046 RepID=A0ABQ7GVE4_DUNSA|nr:RNA recognition motif 2-domain-containing protein [Dunaliella salina]|eukprot:KAF5838586.1 RNA recognition motif 2-domain-containing protein [Dunaliella salina]